MAFWPTGPDKRYSYDRYAIMAIGHTWAGRSRPKPTTLATLKDSDLLRYRGKRSGIRRRPKNHVGITYPITSNADDKTYNIPVITGNSRARSKPQSRKTIYHGHTTTRCLRPIKLDTDLCTFSRALNIDQGQAHPSIFLLNPTGLAKPNAIDQLRIDLETFVPDIAIIVESWLKAHHHDRVFSIPDYRLFRYDRKQRRGGGVAIYCQNKYAAQTYTPSIQGNPDFESLWIQLKHQSRHYIIGGVYHPPKPIYKQADLIIYLTKVLDEIFQLPELPIVVLGGDFNLLPSNAIPAMGLHVSFDGPTHMGHALDRIYASQPIYLNCNPVTSTIKTKHSAVLATSSKTPALNPTNKGVKKSLHLRSPSGLAKLQNILSAIDWSTTQPPYPLDISFSNFYDIIRHATEEAIPCKTVTIRPRDPPYMTPYIKFLIRKRNTLYRRHKFEAADALAARIGANIVKSNSSSFQGLERGSRKLWDEVRRLTEGRRDLHPCTSQVSSTSLNNHYQAVSTDANYIKPSPKITVTDEDQINIDEYFVFRSLEKIRGTTIGPDGLHTWVLASMAHLLASPIASLFQRSLSSSYVPPNWLISSITPIPKISHPKTESDYRPISITPVLCRILEKFIARTFFYPILQDPNTNSNFSDQYAFRPTGSTTAALIALSQQITDMLKVEPYVRLISLDFSRAFDTINHAYLARALAQLPIPDCIYNWILALLNNRQHCTKFQGLTSVLKYINASIVQGSGLGPSNFITAISGLKTVNPYNRIMKYADDSYLLVPASQINSTGAELQAIETWAASCNLKLNAAKTKEMVVTKPRAKMVALPEEYPGIVRVHELTVLGVILTENFSMAPHVAKICTRASQSIYALRLLRSHGLAGQRLFDVVSSTTLARLTYAMPAWIGYINEEQKGRINAVIKKLIRFQYLPPDQPLIEELSQKSDLRLFKSVISNPNHILNKFLPPIKTTKYSMRSRPHNRQLPMDDSFERRGFINRLLFVV